MSAAAVTPTDEQHVLRLLQGLGELRRRVGGGTFELTSSLAASTNKPVGLPLASRSILPPTGSLVAAVMPAAFSAALLTTTAWPSTRSSTTGRSDTAASRSAAVGKRFSAKVPGSSRARRSTHRLDVQRRRRAAAAAGPRPSSCRRGRAAARQGQGPSRAHARRSARAAACGRSPSMRLVESLGAARGPRQACTHLARRRRSAGRGSGAAVRPRHLDAVGVVDQSFGERPARKAALRRGENRLCSWRAHSIVRDRSGRSRPAPMLQTVHAAADHRRHPRRRRTHRRRGRPHADADQPHPVARSSARRSG